MSEQQKILDYWFNDVNNNPNKLEKRNALWWGKNSDTDQHIKNHFSDLLNRAKKSELNTWKNKPKGRLALIILLDQFSRNIYRNSPNAYAQDKLALELAVGGIKKNVDKMLNPFECTFLYMPLEHSEDLKMQNDCVALFQTLLEIVPAHLKMPFEGFLKFAIAHRDIIKKFGRFPHRNHILGRKTTEEEAIFLQNNPGF